ncbi:uncharacterized protein JN550_013037 [Neoarthrinium moseri]|uniref:uncharacterized protein n=1 Tax=Neoarthrinium moseri TaxID=1658444 RepID=UPI001FDCC00E|nr:uncharacterized protein JN550_013037 [Neoarthrinium moseri]KAI1857774.1 hypothetical protein JN550_013037 [Neoarthrinium moseri]
MPCDCCNPDMYCCDNPSCAYNKPREGYGDNVVGSFHNHSTSWCGDLESQESEQPGDSHKELINQILPTASQDRADRPIQTGETQPGRLPEQTQLAEPRGDTLDIDSLRERLGLLEISVADTDRRPTNHRQTKGEAARKLVNSRTKRDALLDVHGDSQNEVMAEPTQQVTGLKEGFAKVVEDPMQQQLKGPMRRTKGSLSDEADILRADLEQHTRMTAASENHVARLKLDVAHRDERISQLEDELEKIKISSEKRMIAQYQDLQPTIMELRDELQLKEEELGAQGEQIKRQSDIIENQNEEIAYLQHTADNLDDELDKVHANNANLAQAMTAETSKLKDKFACMTEETSKLQDQLKVKDSVIGMLAEITKASRLDPGTDLCVVGYQVDQIVQQALDSQQSPCHSMRDDTLGRMTKELIAASAQVTRLEQDLEDKKLLEERLQGAQKAQSSLQNQLQRTITGRDETEATMKGDIAQITKKHEQSLAAMQIKDFRINHLLGQIGTQAHALENAQRTYWGFMVAAKAHVDGLEQKAARLAKQAAAAERELAATAQTLSQQRDANRQLSQQAQQKAGLARLKYVEACRLTGQNAELEAAVAELRGQSAALAEEVWRLRAGVELVDATASEEEGGEEDSEDLEVRDESETEDEDEVGDEDQCHGSEQPGFELVELAGAEHGGSQDEVLGEAPEILRNPISEVVGFDGPRGNAVSLDPEIGGRRGPFFIL